MTTLARIAAFGFWLFAFLTTIVTVLYLVGFVHNRYTFNSVDSGLQIPPAEAAVVDLLLLALFGLQHSGMARRAIKRLMPVPIERAVYLVATNVVLAILFFRWEPIPELVWFTQTRWPFMVLLSLAGLLITWAVAAQGARRFFGFDQVWAFLQGRRYEEPPFTARGPYRWTNHPMMIGTVVFLWATPEMSQGHLLLSAVLTLYILAATILFNPLESGSR